MTMQFPISITPDPHSRHSFTVARIILVIRCLFSWALVCIKEWKTESSVNLTLYPLIA